MQKKKVCVCMLGLKTCGKDYNAEVLLQNGYKKIALADPLRQTVWNILGYTPDDYQKFKNCELRGLYKKNLWGSIKIKEMFDVTTVRKILQNTGTEFKRLFGQDYWANLWKQSVLVYDSNVVCTDVRFTYEVEKAMSLTRSGYIVKFVWCCYKDANFTEILKDNHESELFNQFLYLNNKRYGLQDGCFIPHKVLRQAIKDFRDSKIKK